MAALDFPNAPTVGATYTAPTGAVYTWDGAAWKCSGVLSTGTAAGGDLTGTYPNPTIAPLAVTTAKLAIGATVNASVVGNFPTSFSSTTTGAAVTVLTLPTLTTRGGWVLLMGGPGAKFVATTGGATLYVILARNGATMIQWHYDTQGAGGNISIMVPPVSWIDNPTAGASIYSYAVFQTVANTFLTAPDNAGSLRAVELA